MALSRVVLQTINVHRLLWWKHAVLQNINVHRLLWWNHAVLQNIRLRSSFSMVQSRKMQENVNVYCLPLCNHGKCCRTLTFIVTHSWCYTQPNNRGRLMFIAIYACCFIHMNWHFPAPFSRVTSLRTEMVETWRNYPTMECVTQKTV